MGDPFADEKEKEAAASPAASKPGAPTSSGEAKKAPTPPPGGGHGGAGIVTPSGKKIVERVGSGIKGFDELLDGGLVKNSINIVSGGIGTGKQTLVFQYLIKGIEEFHENGCFLSYESDKERIYENMATFGWNFEQYEKDGQFAFLEFNPQQILEALLTGGGLLESAIQSVGAKRVVIDWIETFVQLGSNEMERRKSMYLLFRTLRRWGCTVIMTVNQSAKSDSFESNLIGFQVDGIVLLYNVRQGSSRQRAIEILKMRGTRHKTSLYPLDISNVGMVIHENPLEEFDSL